MFMLYQGGGRKGKYFLREILAQIVENLKAFKHDTKTKWS